MNYYIGDPHFGHSNIIRLDSRPFGNTDEMDNTLITLWNGRVTDDDDVYVLGDFCYRSEKPASFYAKRLKGRKHLIIGNHDGELLKDSEAMSCFVSADKMLHVADEGNQICLCHFPIAEWNGFFKGHYHIYAHIHSRTDGVYRYMATLSHALNAGCMINNYMPVTFKELVRNNELFKSQNPV